MESSSFTKYISSAIFTVFLTGSCSVVYAAAAALPPVIGQVVWVKNTLKAQQPNAESRTLARRSPIYEHDTITSEPKSSGEVTFTDDSAVALQESSAVTINQYSHKKGAAASTDTFVVAVIKGGFRSVTGAISKNNPGGYKATTPVGTIGVLGTIYSVFYNPQKGSLAAKLDKGSIIVSNKEGEVTLTKCASGEKKGAGATACINKLYAEVEGANKAPKSVSQKPAVFDSEPALSMTGFPKSDGGSGLVGSFCIN